MTEQEVAFRALVLQALWLLVRNACKGYPAALMWRANAISWLDFNGNQSDGAAKYRRDVTFPE